MTEPVYPREVDSLVSPCKRLKLGTSDTSSGGTTPAVGTTSSATAATTAANTASDALTITDATPEQLSNLYSYDGPLCNYDTEAPLYLSSRTDSSIQVNRNSNEVIACIADVESNASEVLSPDSHEHHSNVETVCKESSKVYESVENAKDSGDSDINVEGITGVEDVTIDITESDNMLSVSEKPWVRMMIANLEAKASTESKYSIKTDHNKNRADAEVKNDIEEFTEKPETCVNVKPESSQTDAIPDNYSCQINNPSDGFKLAVCETDMFDIDNAITRTISDMIEYVESDAGESAADQDDNLDSILAYTQDGESVSTSPDLELSDIDLEFESQEIHVDSFVDDNDDDVDSELGAARHGRVGTVNCCQDALVCRLCAREERAEVIGASMALSRNDTKLNNDYDANGDSMVDTTLNEEDISIGNERHVSGLEDGTNQPDGKINNQKDATSDLDVTLQNDAENVGRPEPEGFEDDTFAKLHALPNASKNSNAEEVHDGLNVDLTESESAIINESRNVLGMSETVLSPGADADVTCMSFVSEKNSVRPLLTSTPVCSVRNLVQFGHLESMAEEAAETLAEEETVITDYIPVVPNVTMLSENTVVPLCTSTPMDKPLAPGRAVRNENIVRNMSEEKGFEIGRNGQLESKHDLRRVTHGDKGSEIHTDERTSKKRRDSKLRRENRDSKREKRKIKGTRVERFKEYLGPGLTSSVNENDGVANASKKDFVKDTDIEKNTLTEYKGFGLTGPMPEHYAKTSTPLPPRGLSVRNPNIVQNDLRMLGKKHKLTDSKMFGVGGIPRWLSAISHVSRPAGTEGFLPETLTGNPASFHSKVKQPQNEDIETKAIQGQAFQQVPSKRSSNIQLSVDSGKGNSGTGSSLKPDEVYPSSRGDKSESNSNRSEKSDQKSDKFFDPKCLQNPGQLKLSAYMNFGLLTVHIVQGRQLSTKWKSSCDSFVKMSLIPDDGKKPKCKTEVVSDSNNPLYDEKFSLELNEEDHSKRLLITVWHRDQNASVNEFLGCMSFGLRHLTNPKKEVSGWYYLLTEEIGRKKHLQVSHKQKPHLKVRAHSNIPSVNKDVWGTESLQLDLQRGKHGFGFSVVEACPVRVGRVDGASPAEASGLHPGDIIIRLNKQNVSRSTASSVAKLVKHTGNSLTMEVQRPRPVTYEQLESEVDDVVDGYRSNQSEADRTVPQMFTLLDDEDKENEISVDNDTLYPINPSLASLATSTPLPLLARGHRTAHTSETRKQEAIHRLLSLELDFIDVMHSGMQRFSRPLRHCILSHSQHTALFQNIEKLTTISEYHVKQMHDNAPSSFVSEDTDTSYASDNHNFIHSIGMIYQSKVHMLCQAYDLYARGISSANQALSDLRRSEDFMKFIREPMSGNQPSISAFIHRPVQHVRELYRVIQEVLLTTSLDSPDYNGLKQVVEGLKECTTNITNYSCERVQSMSSIASRDSKTSFTCSMKSQSSTASSATSSSSKGQGHGSLQRSTRSVDTDVMKIQDKLVFSSNVPVFQLCHDDRHLIFSGDMFRWEGHQWIKIHLFLFTDLLLETVKDADGYLRVLREPTLLRDIAGMDAQRQHGSEFVLYCNPRVLSSGRSSTKKVSLRAPSTEQKYAWKSLIEQRVFAVRGALEYYSSTSDVSSSSASAIII